MNPPSLSARLSSAAEALEAGVTLGDPIARLELAGLLSEAAGTLAAIVAQLDGTTWSSDTLDEIAQIVRRVGFEVREPEGGNGH